jgi:hypothetical protein
MLKHRSFFKYTKVYLPVFFLFYISYIYLSLLPQTNISRDSEALHYLNYHEKTYQFTFPE